MRSRAACNAPDNSALVDMAAEALVEGQRQIDLGARQAISDAGLRGGTLIVSLETALRTLPWVSNVRGSRHRTITPPATRCAVSRLGRPEYGTSRQPKRQAGVWYVAAAQAAATGQPEACGAYVQAACYAKCSGSGVYWDRESMKASERIARAAQARLAGNVELYEMWLKAADATVAAVVQQQGQRSDAKHTRAQNQGRGD
jgi:hypothetical protein